MPNKITETAQLQCDKGTIPSKLKVSSQKFSYADNKLIATEADKKAGENVQPFGLCKITKKACKPNIIQWEKASKKDIINNLKILLETSTCKCTIGGNIKVADKGHGTITQVED